MSLSVFFLVLITVILPIVWVTRCRLPYTTKSYRARGVAVPLVRLISANTERCYCNPERGQIEVVARPHFKKVTIGRYTNLDPHRPGECSNGQWLIIPTSQIPTLMEELGKANANKASSNTPQAPT